VSHSPDVRFCSGVREVVEEDQACSLVLLVV